MLEIWRVLGPILIVDVLNPVLLALLVYAAGSRRGVLNASAALAGHTLAYFGAGIVIALAMEPLSHRLQNPEVIDYWISLVIGVLLIGLALKPTTPAQTQVQPQLSPLKALMIGALVNFIGIPFALPYFAALSQILKADLTATQAVAQLLVYNLLYALPFAAVPLLTAVMGQRSQLWLGRLNARVERVAAVLMPLMLIAVGLTLVVDFAFFYATGRGLL